MQAEHCSVNAYVLINQHNVTKIMIWIIGLQIITFTRTFYYASLLKAVQIWIWQQKAFSFCESFDEKG